MQRPLPTFLRVAVPIAALVLVAATPTTARPATRVAGHHPSRPPQGVVTRLGRLEERAYPGAGIIVDCRWQHYPQMRCSLAVVYSVLRPGRNVCAGFALRPAARGWTVTGYSARLGCRPVLHYQAGRARVE